MPGMRVAQNSHVALIYSKYLLMSVHPLSRGGWAGTEQCSGVFFGAAGICIDCQKGEDCLVCLWSPLAFVSAFKGLLQEGLICLRLVLLKWAPCFIEECVYWKYDEVFRLMDTVLSF